MAQTDCCSRQSLRVELVLTNIAISNSCIKSVKLNVIFLHFTMRSAPQKGKREEREIWSKCCLYKRFMGEFCKIQWIATPRHLCLS